MKENLLKQWQQIDIAVDPLVYAWVTLVLCQEGINNNPLLEQVLEQDRQWLKSDEAWSGYGHLGSAGLLCSVFRRLTDKFYEQLLARIIESVRELWNRGLSKFSRLNDPDFIFGVAVGVGDQFPDDLLQGLRQHCERNAQLENWRRRLLFAAAAHELKGTISPFYIQGSDLEVHEIFPALWFAGRYPSLVKDEDSRRGTWEAFDRLKEGISLESSANGGGILYTASPIDVAMLYEALLNQTRAIDPVTLFNNIPFHPEIRRAAESLFVKGEYVMSVFQASVVFIDAVKNRSGYPTDKAGKPLDGVDLMVHAFGSKSPALKFNELKTQAERNEQRGLSCIAEGLVSAFRNPKGHVPAPNIALDPYEALDQLATISYLMRRLDSSRK
ncbi:MAG TPA: TIGR02391 family protein [Anaerolineae bacterium]|nr:TIGR02391 family protein [Anaerolineae bacterium]